MDPESQALQLRKSGVVPRNIFRDIGVSGATGTQERRGWHALDSRLAGGDTLVVVRIDRVGRRWLDTLNSIQSLRAREVKLRSLDETEGWTRYLELDSDDPMAFFGQQMLAFCAWVAHQEREVTRRRTREGLERARAAGKTLGRPRVMSPPRVEAAKLLLSEGASLREVSRTLGVSTDAVRNALGVKSPKLNKLEDENG